MAIRLVVSHTKGSQRWNATWWRSRSRVVEREFIKELKLATAVHAIQKPARRGLKLSPGGPRSLAVDP